MCRMRLEYIVIIVGDQDATGISQSLEPGQNF